MTLFAIISNLFLITNLIALPIGDNYYYQQNAIEEGGIFFNIKSEELNQKSKFPLKVINDSLGVQVSAKSVLVKDINSNKILWSKNSDEVRAIASITKLMTAIVLMEHESIDWEKEIVIDSSNLNGDFNKLKIYNWEKIKFKDLYISSIVASSNTGIRLLIKNIDISEEEFVEKMNAKALELGLNNTKFEDPTGLSANNVSTATDVLKLASKAFTYPNIKEATSHRNYSFRTIDSDRLINIKNTNDLIGGYLNIEAGKTGYIEAAGFCLVSEVSYEEQGPILVVVLGSDSHYARFSDLKAISTWIFNNYLWQ
jgi:serine-type D-Ala-D-Ala endopeptidase (penicillin-binding protein 7)